MRFHHRKAQHFTRPGSSAKFVSMQQLVDRHKISQAFRHLLAFDLKMAVVHPDIGHDVMAEGRAALREFILVMRKYEVDAAPMNIEDLAKILRAHRRALDVPAGPPAPPRALPARLIGA